MGSSREEALVGLTEEISFREAREPLQELVLEGKKKEKQKRKTKWNGIKGKPEDI